MDTSIPQMRLAAGSNTPASYAPATISDVDAGKLPRDEVAPSLGGAANVVLKDISGLTAGDPEVKAAQSNLDTLKTHREVLDAIDKMLSSPRITRPILYPTLYQKLDEAYSEKVSKSKTGLRIAQAASVAGGAGIIISGLCTGLTLGNLTMAVLAMTALPLLFLPSLNNSLKEIRKESLLRKETAKAQKNIREMLPDAENKLREAKKRAEARVIQGAGLNEEQSAPVIEEEPEFVIIGGVRLEKKQIDEVRNPHPLQEAGS